MNIYVGNLPFTMTEDKLMDLFVGFGEVSRINLITDKVTGQLRGFGFVEMPTQSEAEAAIKGLDGTSVEGRAIQVNIARDRPAMIASRQIVIERPLDLEDEHTIPAAHVGARVVDVQLAA